MKTSTFLSTSTEKATLFVTLRKAYREKRIIVIRLHFVMMISDIASWGIGHRDQFSNTPSA